MRHFSLFVVASAMLLAGCSCFCDDQAPQPMPPPSQGNPPPSNPPAGTPPPDYPAPGIHAPRQLGRHHQEIDFELNDQVLFDYKSAQLSPRASGAIAKIAEEARKYENANIEIDGYTDTVGSQGYNLGLSRARAEAVADELANDGVDARHMSVRGLGKRDLAVPTRNNVEEPRNRRVIVRILPN